MGHDDLQRPLSEAASASGFIKPLVGLGWNQMACCELFVCRKRD
ncbi:hypothetical protein HMPREF0004_1257 [Achromobacter piechaudii ATCC 43553]|uniref:Uncharacterized protein n=1 Tax=Achromobacter piechaudii ATCC 43553 TaxID=742159 RepID=D4X710_9BURK|nr:hypothetical protein HMPREF0004_1257 [Achromobacter piechaudii ATCC 43553]